MAVASARMDEVVVQVLVSIPGGKRRKLPPHCTRAAANVLYTLAIDSGASAAHLFARHPRVFRFAFVFVRRVHVHPAAHAMSPRIPPAMMAIGAGTL